MDQNDATGNTVLIGGAYGGVWRSTNAAASDPSTVIWTPLIDNQPTLAVGAIAVQPNAPDPSSRVILIGTGEPNSSGDSYYGLGILRSADGGSTWSLITGGTPFPPFKGVGFSSIVFHPTNPNLAVASTAGTNGFANGAEVNNPQSRGLFYSTDAGQSWHFASVQDSGITINTASATNVVFNPAADNGAGAWYAAIRFHGFYKSSDGQNWTRLAAQPGGALLSATACPTGTSGGCPIYRGTLAVRPGRNEMYAWFINFSSSTGLEQHRGFYKSTDGGVTWSAALTTAGFASCGTNDACGAYQTSYNMYLAAVPHGTGTDLYAGGGNIFRCTIASGASNCNGPTWINLTHVYSCNPLSQLAHVHPDQHGIDFSTANPDIIYFGNDGGVYRSLTSTTGLTSNTCTTPNAFQNLNATMGSMTEFVSFSQHPIDSTSFLGGTQDNGSPATSAGNLQWQGVNGGDGGFNEINQSNGTVSFVENTDVTIQRCTDGSPIKCKAADYPLVINVDPTIGTKTFPDHGDFYTPFILDPQNQNRILIGTCRVWRGNADGSGFSANSFVNALTTKLDNSATTACTGGENDIVKSLAAGGPLHSSGSQAVYAGTINGHLWFTTTADSGDASWQGWILSDPAFTGESGYPISDIALDPTDPTGGSVYVTVMGFLGTHVWKVTGAADPSGPFFTDMTGDLPDAPADSVAVDPGNPSIVYVGTDLGVFRTSNGGVNWVEYGPNLPNVPVTRLRTFNVGSVHELRASTYGRGVWKIPLASFAIPDYRIAISDSPQSVYPGQGATFHGTVSFLNGYTDTVNLSCAPTGGSPDGGCAITPSSVSAAGSFTLDVSSSVSTDFIINVHGNDGSIQHDTPFTLHVVDFLLNPPTPNPISIPRGTSGTLSFFTGGISSFNDNITVTCDTSAPLPAGVTCSTDVSPAGLHSLTINTLGTTPLASTGLTLKANAPGSPTKTQSFTLNTTANRDFELATQPNPNIVLPGASVNFDVEITSQDAYTGSIVLTCPGANVGALAGVTCNFNPTPLSEVGSSVLTVSATAAATTGDKALTVQGFDGGNKLHQNNVTLKVQNFTVSGTPATLQTITNGNSQNFTANFAAVNGFNQPITVGCANLAAFMTCNPVPPIVTPGTSSTVTVTTVNGTTPLATTTFQITGAALGVTRASANLQLRTSDFQVTSTTPSTSANAGSNGTISVNVKALNGYAKPVALSCSNLPANVGCTFSANNFTPSSTGTAVTVTLTSTTAAAFGIYNTISLNALGDLQMHSLPLTFTVKDFHLSLNPTSVTLPLPPSGQTLTTTTVVTFFADQGFSSAVTPACVTPPAAITCAFNPTTVTPTLVGANTTLTLTSTSSAASATNPLNIKGTAGTLVHQVPLTITTGSPNFTQAVALATQNVTAGSSAQYTVTFTPLGGMTQDIAVSCGPALPPGVTCTPNPAVVTPGVTPLNQSVVTLATNVVVPTPATNDIVAIMGVSAALNNLTRSSNVTLSVKDFSVSANALTVSTNVGTNITDTILVKGLNGFTGNIPLTCAIVGTPAGTTCTLSNLNPAASAAGTSVTATIASNAGTTPQGSYQVQVTGTNSGQQKVANFTVNIKDFNLGLGSSQITIPQPPAGQSSTVTVPITLTAENGFNTSTALACAGQPTGVTCAFSPVSGIPTVGGLHSTLTITGASTAAVGAHDITIKGTAGSLIRQQTLEVDLWGPNFTEAVTPTTQNVTAGSTAPYTVTFTPLGGMTDDIVVSCSGVPQNVSCTPVPAVVNPGNGYSSVVTLATVSGTAAANSTIAITGTSVGIGVARSANVTLSVKNFSVTANSLNIATNVGTNITDNIVVKGLNGFAGNVALGCVIVGAPAGTNCTLSNSNPTASSTGTSVTATITSDAAQTQSGTYTVQVTGTNSGQQQTAQPITLNIRDFALGTGTTSITIPQPPAGQSSALTVPLTLTAQNGFNSSTSLSCTGQPSGITCAFSPAFGIPAALGLHSTLTVTSTSTVPVGTYHLLIKATAGTLVRTQALDVADYGPNFTAAVTPTTQNVTAGSSAQYTVTYTPLGGMTQDIAVSCGPALPPGVTCTPNPAVVTPGVTPLNQSVVTLATNVVVPTPATNDIVAIMGVSAALNNLTRSSNVTLSVKDFSVSANALTVSTNVGTNITDAILVKGLNGFTGNIPLTCAIVGTPAGATCTLSNLNPAASAAGTSVTATIASNAGTTPQGSYQVQVTGTTGAGSHVGQFTVNMKDFTLGIDLATQTIAATGGTVFADYTLTATALIGFNTRVALTCATPLPTGVSCGFGAAHTTSVSVAPTVAGLVVPFRITVTGSTAPNTYGLNIHGTAGTLIRVQPVQLQLQ